MGDWQWVATAAAGVLAFIGALLAAGLMSARERLRRRLDRTTAIWERMNPGPGKHHLGLICERQALDLAYRTYVPHRATTVWGGGLLVISVLLVSGVIVQGRELPGWPWVFVMIVGIAGALMLLTTGRQDRIKWVDERLRGGPAQPPGS